MALLVARQAAEVLGPPNKTTHLPRFAVNVASQAAANSGSMLVARLAAEVLGEAPTPSLSFTRFAVNVASQAAANAGSLIVTRHCAEVMGLNQKLSHFTRFAVNVASQAPANTGSLLVSRHCAEVMGAGVTPYDAPPAPVNVELFNQNWLAGISIQTVFRTDVFASPDTGDESRTGLSDRPNRHSTVRWTVHTKAEHSRLLDLLKDLTDEETAIPLMVDLTTIDSSAISGTTVLPCSTRYRRFFLGAYAFVLYRNYKCDITSWQLVQIVDKTDTSITISPGLNANAKAGQTCIAPAMIVEPISESTISLEGNETWTVETQFEEVASWALPASNDAIPDGMAEFEGLPVLSEEPNSVQPIQLQITRAGERSEFGRGTYVEAREPRHREAFEVTYSARSRRYTWPKLQLFESRRGRLRPFWFASPYQLQAPVQSLGANYVEVVPAGNLTAFTRDLTHIAVITTDGSTAVREVSAVSLVLGVWRISILGSWPPAVQGKVITRVVRAYLVRFADDDALVQWDNGDHATAKLRIIELIEERPIPVQP